MTKRTIPNTAAENLAAGERIARLARTTGTSVSALHLEQSKDRVLAMALVIAHRDGFTAVKRNMIAAALGVSERLVTYHFPTMPQLRRDVMRAAVRCCELRVIGQGLAMRDRHALKASDALKDQAIKSLAA